MGPKDKQRERERQSDRKRQSELMAKGREVYLLRANSVTVLNKRTQGHGQVLNMVAQPTATVWGPKSEERE